MHSEPSPGCLAEVCDISFFSSPSMVRDSWNVLWEIITEEYQEKPKHQGTLDIKVKRNKTLTLKYLPHQRIQELTIRQVWSHEQKLLADEEHPAITHQFPTKITN